MIYKHVWQCAKKQLNHKCLLFGVHESLWAFTVANNQLPEQPVQYLHYTSVLTEGAQQNWRDVLSLRRMCHTDTRRVNLICWIIKKTGEEEYSMDYVCARHLHHSLSLVLGSYFSSAPVVGMQAKWLGISISCTFLKHCGNSWEIDEIHFYTNPTPLEHQFFLPSIIVKPLLIYLLSHLTFFFKV